MSKLLGAVYFLDFFDILTDVLDLLGNTSTSPETNYHQKAPVKKKTKYLTEKISAVLLFFSSVLLFFVFKNPPSAENYVADSDCLFTDRIFHLAGLFLYSVFFGEVLF
ncbi:hypothetical protein [uncultured Chryseobacterium sp.]|uniref:hypothetical protein n=1 Tax=uncultured Chryseobacterium sp. TaxID=259322 RepID=UPI0025F66DE5|nr:hypothetical protein [uncultured Chryseobacterium sp.]